MEEYVLKTINHKKREMFFERLSVYGCPIDDYHVENAKRFSFADACQMASRLNHFIRSLPNFTESWLYRVVKA